MRKKLMDGKAAWILAVFLVFFMAAGVAEDLDALWENAGMDAAGQWWYVLENGGATILCPEGPLDVELSIPGELDGFPVTAIGAYAFDSDMLERVALPDTVISIGDGAFIHCFSLTEIALPDSLISIGNGAFADSSLSRITLPGSLVSIGNGAFSMCMLTEITLPESVISVGQSPWWGCHHLQKIEVLPGNPVYASQDGVLFDRSAGMLHTYPCGKEGGFYAVPDGVAAIGDLAFEDCIALTQVVLPVSLTSIGEDAFSGCWNLTLTVTQGSFAERYAAENDIPCVLAAE